MGREVAALKRMIVPQLRDMYPEVFGDETRARHKAFLTKRIIRRLQAVAFGDLALHARMGMVDAITNGDPLTKDSLMRHIGEMEKNLAGPPASTPESLAVRRIVACWLEARYAADAISTLPTLAVDRQSGHADQQHDDRTRFWYGRHFDVAGGEVDSTGGPG